MSEEQDKKPLKRPATVKKYKNVSNTRIFIGEGRPLRPGDEAMISVKLYDAMPQIHDKLVASK